MKNTLLFIALILFLPGAVYAQNPDTANTPLWTKKASFGVNVTNVGLLNWAGGGQSSFSISSLAKAQAKYQKGKNSWINTFEAGYGVVRQGNIQDFRKSDDRLILSSKFARSFTEKGKVAYSALMDFRTQMDNGWAYSQDSNDQQIRTLQSAFFAPAYLTTSIGAELKPNEDFYLMISPISGKITFVMDENLAAQGAYGVDSGSNLRLELGAVLTCKWDKDIMENINFQTSLNLFQAYRRGAFVDVLWDNLLELKVNDYISSTISTQMIYDEDVDVSRQDGTVGPAVQFKHVFTIGFLMKL